MAKPVDVKKNVKAIEKAAPPIVKAKKQELPGRVAHISVVTFDNGTGDVHGLFTPAGKKMTQVIAEYAKLSAKDKKTVDEFVDLVKSL